MTIFKEAARLADEASEFPDTTDEVVIRQWRVDKLLKLVGEMRDFLRTIAALEGVSVESFGACLVDPEEKQAVMFYSPDMIPAADSIKSKFELVHLHTQQSLEAAVLKARDAAIERVATWYANEGWRLDEDAVPDAIRALISQPEEVK